MKTFIEKFLLIERDIAKEKGPFVLFALFEREDVSDRWDVVLSAPWFSGDEKKALRFIVDKIKIILDQDEMVKLSRVVLLDPDEPTVQQANTLVQVEHRISEFRDCVINGLAINRAYIITSRRQHTTRASSRRVNTPV